MPARPSDPLDDPFAEQTLRAKQQETERDHIGEPALDAAAKERTPIELAELLADADDQAPDDRTGNGREAAEDQDRQRLERDDLERKRNLRPRAPHDPRRERNDAGGEPYGDPYLLERDADRQSRLVAVRNRPQRTSDPGFLEEEGERRHHDRGDDRG